MLNRSLLTFIVASFTSLLTFSPTPAKAQQDTLVFGIVPQQSASRLAQMWVPFMQALEARLDRPVRFATMKDIPTFEQCLAQGAYDIAYMNPYHYTTFSAQSGYRAFAHQANKKLKGLLVVKKDSPIQSLDPLNNQNLAFPSPAAFGASVLPRAELKGRGLTITPRYVKSHDSVYRAVASGVFPAGGGVQRTFNNTDPAIRDQLRIIYNTKAYTPHAFAVSPKVSEATQQAIQAAMLDIAQTNPELVKAIGMSGFSAATDQTWNDVRALNLEKSHTQINQQGDAQCRLN